MLRWFIGKSRRVNLSTDPRNQLKKAKWVNFSSLKFETFKSWKNRNIPNLTSEYTWHGEILRQ